MTGEDGFALSSCPTRYALSNEKDTAFPFTPARSNRLDTLID